MGLKMLFTETESKTYCKRVDNGINHRKGQKKEKPKQRRAT